MTARSESLTTASLLPLLAEIVRGPRVDLSDLDRVDPQELCELAEKHGVLPILADRLSGVDRSSALVSRLRREAHAIAAADLFREADLVRLVAGLDEARVSALLMKGAQLAYTHYARPDLRPRLDTDLLVAPAERSSAHDAIVGQGYEASRQFAGDLVTYQRTYIKKRAGAVTHVLDLHWRVANPQQFGAVLTYDELAAAAVPVPKLGRAARGLGPAHALLLSCIHPVAHHAQSRCLIWGYDVHLLARGFSDTDWRQFAGLADDRRVAGVCRHSLDLARQWFGTHVPDEVMARLIAPARTDTATAAYLAPGRRHFQIVLADFRSLTSWHDRGRFVRQHLFPPARYMRDVYAPASGAPLAVLYARRAMRGAMKWLVRL